MNISKNKLIRNIVTLIVILGIIVTVFICSDDKELKEYVVKESIEVVTQLADNESTKEIIEISELDEQTVEVEQQVENDAQVEQENIAYEGSSTGNGLSLLGESTGLTYYSQADSRWANYQYTSTNNATQTMKSSACGPTSAAMVVSSSKGMILPTTMADLFVENGFRTASNGTAWSAYSWVADYFDFNDYAYTSNIDTAIDYLNKGYYVVASCGSGLFTYGGHYIVLVGIDNDTIKIYDPYLYNGKFDTASRKNKVHVDGNTVYCSIDNFKAYANSKGFWCYSNDSGKVEIPSTNITITNSNSNAKNVNYQVKVTANSSLRIREGASTSYSIKGRYYKGTIVTIVAESNGWGKTNKGWISLAYTSKVSTVKKITGYTTGKYKTTSNIHVRTGPSTAYSYKNYKQLTTNARKQNKKLNNYYYNGYLKGVVCDVTKISGNWGYTKSGWICLTYCKKI